MHNSIWFFFAAEVKSFRVDQITFLAFFPELRLSFRIQIFRSIQILTEWAISSEIGLSRFKRI